jgi:hypothetical protein
VTAIALHRFLSLNVLVMPAVHMWTAGVAKTGSDRFLHLSFGDAMFLERA